MTPSSAAAGVALDVEGLGHAAQRQAALAKLAGPGRGALLARVGFESDPVGPQAVPERDRAHALASAALHREGGAVRAAMTARS